MNGWMNNVKVKWNILQWWHPKFKENVKKYLLWKLWIFSRGKQINFNTITFFQLVLFWLMQFTPDICQFSSVQFSRSVMSDSLRPHESQHTRPPCPSPTPGVYSNSCPSSWWCHPAISSSVVPFSSCLQSLPASGSFPMSQLFTWGG